jgi:transcriptional regulator with XRE-family HTH domain
MAVIAESPLAARRLEIGLSRRELALRANCSPSTVKLVEQGWRGATDETVRRITLALGLLPSEL